MQARQNRRTGAPDGQHQDGTSADGSKCEELNVSKSSPTHDSQRSVADAAANLDILTEPVDPVVDDGSATAVVPLTIVTVVRVRADVDAARTYGKIHSVRCGYRSRSQCDQRGE